MKQTKQKLFPLIKVQIVLQSRESAGTVGGKFNVYTCAKCGKLPEWGSGFLACPNNHYESLDNNPRGRAVKDWNATMKKWSKQ